MIEVTYECKVCEVRGTVEVPIKEPDVPTMDWMLREVQPAIGKDHARRRPTCPSEHLDVKIRLAPGSAYIGGPSVN